MKEETLASYVYSLRNYKIITRKEMLDLIVRIDSLTEKDTEESIQRGKRGEK